MGVSDALTQTALSARHIPGALLLAAEAGWNQTADDWRMMLAAGRAVGFEDATGRLVASALALPFGREFGWISMVLVTAEWRRMGLATQLLDACIAEHESAGRVPVLDATPDGEKVYLRLGFVGQFGIRRWQGKAAGAPLRANAAVRGFRAGDLAGAMEFDRDVFGGERAEVIRDLAERPGARGWIAEDGRGVLLSREGSRARQIGPLLAETEPIARGLLGKALDELDGPVFLDVPNCHCALASDLAGRGFAQQRPFLRMAKGRKAPFGDLHRMFVVAGPELG